MTDDVRGQVRQRYAAAQAATESGRSLEVLDDGGPGCCSTSMEPAFGADLYEAMQQADLPDEAIAASMGRGPTAVADLEPGERVLDLGSRGGIDVLLSARRVGRTGFAYGVGMTEEMLQLAGCEDAKVEITHQVAPDMHGAIVRARKAGV